MRDQRSSNGENITTRSDRIAHLAMSRLPCSHDKRRDNFDFPHYAWTKVRGKVSPADNRQPLPASPPRGERLERKGRTQRLPFSLLPSPFPPASHFPRYPAPHRANSGLCRYPLLKIG